MMNIKLCGILILLTPPTILMFAGPRQKFIHNLTNFLNLRMLKRVFVLKHRCKKEESVDKIGLESSAAILVLDWHIKRGYHTHAGAGIIAPLFTRLTHSPTPNRTLKFTLGFLKIVNIDVHLT